jgi:hypothetical protein
MPLELGIALGIQYLGDFERRSSGNRHNWLALVPANFLHQKFISDLVGYDPPDHDEKPVTVIKRVATWLSLQPDFSPPTPSPKTIFDAYPGFCQLLQKSKADCLGDLTWPAITKTAEAVIAGMPV